ncbi:MBL fold metallo-hydrolase [Sandaracinobacteroides saxicola]|nr:MBL fold metallo-hydrolase [Sandaracinobacteroides saxicola]
MLIVAAILLGLLVLFIAVRVSLDKPAYVGPVSDHFDGERFFLPGAPNVGDKGVGELLRWRIGRTPAVWPASVPVTPVVPAARVDGEAMVVTMVGHASVLVQTQGLNILTDPLWSARASPVAWAGPQRVRAPGVRFEDLPRIDLVLVSHGHYDHLDLPTLKRLWARDRPLIVTPLGNGTLLAAHGVTALARDWGERVVVRDGIEVIVEPVQHWSSRWGVDRNRALWGGFTVVLPGGNLYFAGDCGYNAALFRAAARHGPVRLALLPVGAYEPRWFMAEQHMNPAEAVAAMADLGAATAVGIHWGTFQLTDEAIDAPRADLAAALADGAIAAERFPALAAGDVMTIAALPTGSERPAGQLLPRAAAPQAGPTR